MDESLFKGFLKERTLNKNFMENILQNQASGWCDDLSTPDYQETFTDVVNSAFRQTIATLTGQLGNDPVAWEWGEVHSFTINHPMALVKLIDKIFGLHRGPFAVGGSFHTVGPYSYPVGNPAGVDHGASQRHIYSLADWDRSLSIIPTGVSGVPASDFYCNQTEMYVKNLYRKDLVSRKKVEEEKLFRMEFTR